MSTTLVTVRTHIHVVGTAKLLPGDTLQITDKDGEALRVNLERDGSVTVILSNWKPDPTNRAQTYLARLARIVKFLP